MVGGYFAGKHFGQYHTDGGIPISDTTTIDIGEFEPIVPVTEPAAAVEEAQPAAEPAAEEPQGAKPAAQAAAAAEPVYDTVTNSRYLSILAKDHYGKKAYWVFIYNANPQLKDPNKIAPGTRVLIPAKADFAGVTEAETDAKAQKLLNELSRRYKL